MLGTFWGELHFPSIYSGHLELKTQPGGKSLGLGTIPYIGTSLFKGPSNLGIEFHNPLVYG